MAKKHSAAALLFAGFSFAKDPGHQPTHWQGHPRDDQVNGRIDNQERRIDTERRDGQISHAQAHQNRSNLRTINQAKHDRRSQDNGHLTRADQRSLNQQLNNNSKQIGH